MSKKEPIDFMSYLRVIGMSLLGALVCLVLIIWYASNDVINHPTYRSNAQLLKEYIKNIVIVQNEDLEAEYPDNYLIDIHLGYLYSKIKEYNKAEQYYLKAVQKAPEGIYRAKYELAAFYIERGRIEDANDIIQAFPQDSNESLLKYQSNLYEKIGDYYSNHKMYDSAMENYGESAFYDNKLKHPIKEKLLKDKLFDASVNYADVCVEKDDIENATEALEKALEIKPKDFTTQYKYALVNVNGDPETSYEYFTKVFKKDPIKVDYTAYYKLLCRLSDYYNAKGEYTSAKLYDFRAKHLLDVVSENLIYPRDVDFKIIKPTLYQSRGKSKVIFEYDLQNISNINIKRLNMEVVYKLGKKEIERYTKEIVTKDCPLGVGDKVIENNTIIPNNMRKYKSSDIPKLVVEIYLYKTPDRKICVYNDKIFKIQIHRNINKNTINEKDYLKYFVHETKNFDSSLKKFKKNIKQK